MSTLVRNSVHAEGRDRGFTLIELLVVVIIIGILAAVAVPVFLNQRESAWDSAAQSDLRNMVTAQETYYTANGEYTDDVDDLVDQGFSPSGDILHGADTYDEGEAYILAARHQNRDDDEEEHIFVQDSNTGVLMTQEEYDGGQSVPAQSETSPSGGNGGD